MQFSAHAYPTNNGDPAIAYVQFTAYWSGAIQVSFDVYDVVGNTNLAPNGVLDGTVTSFPTPTPTPTPTAIPTPTPTPTDTPTPVPVTLSSGTWNDPYGGASYGTGEPVTIVLTVNGRSNGTLQGFWYFPNQSIDTGALTFNRIS